MMCSICMTEIVLHCYNVLVFDQPNDTLSFLLHAHHHTNSRSSSFDVFLTVHHELTLY